MMSRIKSTYLALFVYFQRAPICLLLMSGLCAAVLPSKAEAASKEQEFKAAFLYNFVKYTRWEVDPGSSLTICLLGGNPFGDALDIYRDKTIQGKNLHYTNIESSAEASVCQVVYINYDHDGAPAALQELGDKPILNIGDSEGFLAAGGMINFVRKGSKQKFEVSRKNAASSKLSFSSQMLWVAIVVD